METPCIEWSGPFAGNGYGVKSIKGKLQYVHRIAAQNHFGSIPPKMVVAHKCDNPRCHNPEHLFICTQAENLADMKAKGRSCKGDKHKTRTHPELTLKGEQLWSHKLTEKEVLEIREKYVLSVAGKKSSTSLSALAEQYKVGFQAIHKIVTRKTWKHI